MNLNVCIKCGRKFNADSSNILKNGNKYEVYCWGCMPKSNKKSPETVSTMERFDNSDYGIKLNVIVDRCTGVNYLIAHKEPYGGGGLGITPLLDEDGKLIVTKN